MENKLSSPSAPSHFWVYATMTFSVILGGGSLILFGWFLFAGPLHLADLNLTEMEKLWLDAFLCLSFFIQHSVMVRRSFQQKLVRFIRPEYHSALYAIASGIVLLALIVLWQETDHLFSPYHLFPWLMRGIFLLAVIGFIVAAYTLKGLDALGTGELRRYLKGGTSPEIAFCIRGPYRSVRHPFYFLSLVMIWACPNLTADRLLLGILFTSWIVVGAYLEERDLVAFFGEDYVAYQRQVPMLIPYRPRMRDKTSETSGSGESEAAE